MPTIVIMEDDAALAADWQIGLERAGHTVVQTRSASECLDWLRSNDADLLIADIYVQRDGALVPDGGIKLIGLLRAAGGPMERALLPIIAVTGIGRDGSTTPPVLELAQSLGANAIFRKPVAIPDLMNAIDTLAGPPVRTDMRSAP